MPGLADAASCESQAFGTAQVYLQQLWLGSCAETYCSMRCLLPTGFCPIGRACTMAHGVHEVRCAGAIRGGAWFAAFAATLHVHCMGPSRGSLCCCAGRALRSMFCSKLSSAMRGYQWIDLRGASLSPHRVLDSIRAGCVTPAYKTQVKQRAR